MQENVIPGGFFCFTNTHYGFVLSQHSRILWYCTTLFIIWLRVSKFDNWYNNCLSVDKLIYFTKLKKQNILLNLA